MFKKYLFSLHIYIQYVAWFNSFLNFIIIYYIIYTKQKKNESNYVKIKGSFDDEN